MKNLKIKLCNNVHRRIITIMHEIVCEEVDEQIKRQSDKHNRILTIWSIRQEIYSELLIS